MVIAKKMPKEQLKNIIPIYFEYVGNYIRKGNRLPDELNPINYLSEDIDSMSIREQEKLVLKIEYNIEILKTLLGELSFFN